MKVNHAHGDALTQVTVNLDCTRLVTADTAGRLKLWDISNVDWRKDGDNMISKMHEIWFIQAHKSTVNSVAIVETFKEHPLSDIDGFLLSSGNDCNILLHRLSNGQKVGQFGQSTWNIYDMSTVKRRPIYERKWFDSKKEIWKKFVKERIEEAKRKGLIDEFFKLNHKITEKDELKRLGFVNKDGEGSLEDPNSENENIDHEDFYSDEEADNGKKYKGTKLGGVNYSKASKNDGDGRNRF
jgi:hypothetical protein